ncbi:MAG: anthranilate phosphoribosyltransferase [Clostridiales bacterium]|nr:anthranilate phosphoribosyltransferase [Clostridiales bacterium]
MIAEHIKKISSGKDLTFGEAEEVMDEIMSGKASDVQIAAYLTGLSVKGETVDEITASAKVMRDHGAKLTHDMDVIEIVGTGGDRSDSFNISTTSAFIMAAAGCKVAKHGNRAASSRSGAADCLEALGVNINMSAEAAGKLLKEEGFCFLFAPKYHSAMKFVAHVRKELGISTVFNVLGPLSNPANAKRELVGVYSEDILEAMVKVLVNLGVERCMSVYGQDRLDEISISAPTSICEYKDGEILRYTIRPEDFGFMSVDKSEIVGGTPEENAVITMDILKGIEKGARRNVVLLNAGAGIYLGGMADSIEAGVRLAEEVIDSGRALEKLERIKKLSNN